MVFLLGYSIVVKLERKFHIGIDLGWKEKKTTGVCVLEQEKIVLIKDVFGKDVLKAIGPYLKETKVIAIDAPLTEGRGKGKMRLYEKFLSTSLFRKEKINPLPPALIYKLSDFARELAEDLAERGFVLGINLIEVYSGLIKKICKEKFCLENSLAKTENQKSALICARMASLHFQFKTRWLGYKDGFLFLPEPSFWKKEWQDKFLKAWRGKPYLNYRYLTTNIFK